MFFSKEIKRQIYSNLQHECQTRATRASPATRVRHERHKCDASATQTTRVLHERHECDTSEEKFYFYSDTSKNIFSHPCIYYMASERLQREEQFHFKNYSLGMSRFYAKMRLKSAFKN